MGGRGSGRCGPRSAPASCPCERASTARPTTFPPRTANTSCRRPGSGRNAVDLADFRSRSGTAPARAMSHWRIGVSRRSRSSAASRARRGSSARGTRPSGPRVAEVAHADLIATLVVDGEPDAGGQGKMGADDGVAAEEFHTSGRTDASSRPYPCSGRRAADSSAMAGVVAALGQQ